MDPSGPMELGDSKDSLEIRQWQFRTFFFSKSKAEGGIRISQMLQDGAWNPPKV